MFYNKNTLYFYIRQLIQIRKNSVKPSIKLIDQVSEDIDKQLYKPRKHPGVIKVTRNSVPEDIVKAIHNVTLDFPIKSIVEDSKTLKDVLYHRHAPVEPRELKEKTKEAENLIVKRYGTSKEENSEIDKKIILDRYQHQFQNLLKTKLPQWSSINYDTYTSLQYLICRAAPEYAVLVRIFTELDKKYPDYKPKTFFDFGSGVGTGTWAVKLFWEKSLYEYFSIDVSPDMNDLADVLLKNGFSNKRSTLKGVFRRQFLPASNTQYDIVLSAYSLLELPSIKSRLETVHNLWNKTAGFLVIVEQGNITGFQIINEVRDYILNISQDNAQVVMPCPHDSPCPRFLNDWTPCNFEINYQELPFWASEFRKERFSYIVFRKGQRNRSENSWPRIVRPTLVRSKHTICRLCTSKGKLEEIIFTASKHGKVTYHCARSSKWGDSLPINISELPNDESSS